MASNYSKPLQRHSYYEPPAAVDYNSKPSHVTRSDDHIPVSIGTDDHAYASATRPDFFRQRRAKHAGADGEESDDVDLSMDYDSKLYKAQQKRHMAKKTARTRDWRIVGALTLWACYIRFWKIWQPSSVVFDEVHFGGFASKYIKTRFFMDVHPPLAKMLIALVAKLSGLDSSFDFKDIGKDYIEPGVPYIPIRIFCALTGLLVVPISYMTMRGSGHSIAASAVVALMVCYENGLITNNRLILLDPPLLFFTAATTLMWVNFYNQQHRPFQKWWYIWLVMTGLGLGLTVSCKWVGLFTIATIGVSTVKNLWEIWGDTRISVQTFLRHFAIRAACLIALPIFVYMLMFQIHFQSLPNSGEGDGFMSPQFQQTLDGHSMADTPVEQQVTLYPHRDDNNWWVIQKKDTEETTDIENVKNGDIIRLLHQSTTTRLHSHDKRPSMTDVDYHNEVSTYGFPGFEGDANDYWRVEIIDYDRDDAVSKDRLRTLHSKFRLVHQTSNCALFSHSVKLPEWGWGQQEVTCIKNGKLPKTVWYIEFTENEQLSLDAEKVNYKRPGFLSKFIELNKVMWNTNQGLTASHPYDSRPESWPMLRRGINFWGKDHRHIYLLGNPLVFWGSAAAVFVYVLLKVAFLLLDKRGYHTEFGGLRKFYEESGGFFLAGWLLHYLPFFLMGRQLFLHHYMPALYFGILLFGVGFDLLTIRLVTRKRMMAAIVVVLCVVCVYRRFIPITYGEPWTRDSCESAKWKSTWDFDCIQFHDNLSAYYGTQETVPVFEKAQNAIKSYFGNKDRELPAEAVDVVNIVSDIDSKVTDNLENNTTD